MTHFISESKIETSLACDLNVVNEKVVFNPKGFIYVYYTVVFYWGKVEILCILNGDLFNIYNAMHIVYLWGQHLENVVNPFSFSNGCHKFSTSNWFESGYLVI